MGARQILRRAAIALAPSRLLMYRARRSGPRVALTFDDGPDELTFTLLDLLDQLRVRASFFVVGDQCVRFRREMHEIVRRGHEIASHGYTHTRFTDLDREGLSDELQRTAELLPPSLRRPAILRPPHGALSLRTIAACARHDFTTVMWSIDSHDAKTRDPAKVIDRCAAAVAGDIILLHEGQTWTNEALPAIVTQLRARGLEPAPVGEMI
jgi:peptidoglycan/xylan/chitin deacetylase (PgdA/CDA1 family)